jgi:hypothetical protein
MKGDQRGVVVPAPVGLDAGSVVPDPLPRRRRLPEVPVVPVPGSAVPVPAPVVEPGVPVVPVPSVAAPVPVPVVEPGVVAPVDPDPVPEG